MRTRLCGVFCFSLLLVSTARLLAESPNAGEIRTEKKSFESSSGDVIEYEIGTLFVPENRSEPESRVIGVGFARFPADTDSPAPAVFRLPGGPGGSYLKHMESGKGNLIERSFPELAQLRLYCDVVFFDQRGYSERGDVLMAHHRVPPRPVGRPNTLDDQVASYVKFAKKTVAEFAEREIDRRGYTVKECAHDVAALANALGYDKITLNGTSFGSQWSFAVMRLHPEIVARAMLSGVEPLNHGYDMPSHVFAAIQRMWKTIDDDPRFAPYLPEGGMAEAARVVIERMERDMIKLEAKSGGDGEEETVASFGPVEFPWHDPTWILELYHGQNTRMRMVAVSGMFARTQQVRLIGPLIDTSLGVTPERRYHLWNDAANRYLGRRNFARYLATADIWPSADVGDDFRTPVLCDIPVVFAQGTWDFQTPVENTYEIAPYFVNSRVIIADRGGHGVFRPIAREHPEVWDELVEFLRTGDMEDIPARVTVKPWRRFGLPKVKLPKSG